MNRRIPSRYERYTRTGSYTGEMPHASMPRADHPVKFNPSKPLAKEQQQYARDVAANGLADDEADDGK